MHYRADIDGLRTVAVLPVVAFHLYAPGMTGGFIGVDVFFVISGYLIGSLILADLDAGIFSLGRFYERRARRILPALIVMLVATTVTSSVISYPKTFYDFGQSLLASVLSVSNIYFWYFSGYFDGASDVKPLLHTWSLSVEDQFYILFPPLLIATNRWFPKYRALVLGVLAFLSFGFSVVGVFYASTATFYLIPARAWELLMGVLLALNPSVLNCGKPAREVIAFIGAGLIIIPILFYSKSTPFPGIAALPPCLGTAMIIAAGNTGDTIVKRVLSWRPLVFIGLISYSLYLWHWPIIVLLKQYLIISAPSRMIKALMFVLALICATISWRFIEQPFRKGVLPRRNVFTFAGLGIAIIAGVALAIIGLRGIPSRFPSQVAMMASYMEYSIDDAYRLGSCYIGSKHNYRQYDQALCLTPSRSNSNVLLVGDSHAAHLWYGLSHVLRGSNLMQATATGCKPTVSRLPSDLTQCAQLMNFVFHEILPKKKIDLLIISANWISSDLNAVRETLNRAKELDVKVLLVGPIAEYDAPLPQLLALSIEDGNASIVAKHLVRDGYTLDRIFAEVAVRGSSSYASAFNALCPGGNCVHLSTDGIPLQFDYGHLTREGSLFMAEKFRESGVLIVKTQGMAGTLSSK